MRQTAADFRRSGDELPAWVTLPHSHACVVLRGAPFAVTFGMDRPPPQDAARLVVEERGPLFEGYRASGAPLIVGLEVPEGDTPAD
jgi:hypothetical protein